MDPTATMSASPAVRAEPESAEVRARQLAAARRRATALLAAATVLFVAVTVAGVHGTLLGYVQAGAEASMVGGVADWFAVTALFRHPLGLPIPHTALIVERKDQFAATLGRFVQENFLTAELTRVIDTVEVAPLAGRALRVVIAGGHHAELFGTIVSAADRYLGDHQGELRQLFEGEAPRWVPDAVYRRVFDRLYSRLRERLVTGTIERWDATETSSQLELLLGRDLQYIRINGTVVGAGVGLILHAVVQGLG